MLDVEQAKNRNIEQQKHKMRVFCMYIYHYLVIGIWSVYIKICTVLHGKVQNKLTIKVSTVLSIWFFLTMNNVDFFLRDSKRNVIFGHSTN